LKTFLPIAIFFICASAFAQDLPKTDISIERFNQYPLIQGHAPSGATMSHDGAHIVFGWNETGSRKADVWVLDYLAGTKRQILSASSITDLPRQDDSRTALEKKEQELYDGGIGGFNWSPDDAEIMFSYKGRTWRVKPDGSGLSALIDGSNSIGRADYSLDGKYIGYLSGGNVFRWDRSSGLVKQLTFFSKPNTGAQGFEWSPDSKSLFVEWSDTSKNGHHVLMDYSKDRATVVNIERNWNGDLSADEQFGIVPSDGGIVKFVAGLPTYLWTKTVTWSPDSSKVLIGWISDDDKTFTLSVVDAATVKKSDVYHEHAPYNYISDWRPAEWTRDGKRIDFGTDLIDGKFGFRSVMSIGSDGTAIQKLYAENHDVGAVTRPKNSDRLILVTAARSPLKTEITILEPDGKRTTHVVMDDGYSTGKEFDEAAPPLVSDDGTKIATVASSRTMPVELYSVEPAIKRLTVSQLPEFQKIKWAKFQEVTFPGPDHTTLHGVLIYRNGLDLHKRHPAFLSNMNADSAKLSWGGWFENFAATNLDMVVLCVDFRASWGYGGEFDTGYYRRMGLIDADEAVCSHQYLASLPFVRDDRIGIWGWSYGGYLTCMTLLTKPGVFDTGVAVAPVTNWKSYNEWYTRRRLGLAKDDPKIFEITSPVTYAAGLKDNLLLVHGILDDNVLFQDTAQLIQKLIDNGKYFDEMTYPRDDHSISKETSRPHVFGRIMRYLYTHLYRRQ
jgi:dipeptidyl-peptidase-4